MTDTGAGGQGDRNGETPPNAAPSADGAELTSGGATAAGVPASGAARPPKEPGPAPIATRGGLIVLFGVTGFFGFRIPVSDTWMIHGLVIMSALLWLLTTLIIWGDTRRTKIPALVNAAAAILALGAGLVALNPPTPPHPERACGGLPCEEGGVLRLLSEHDGALARRFAPLAIPPAAAAKGAAVTAPKAAPQRSAVRP